jgi:hypothetical protein
MKFDEFTSTRHEVQREGGPPTFFYLHSHLTKNTEEHIKIELLRNNLCLLEIENHCYTGSLNELEEILWRWYSND